MSSTGRPSITATIDDQRSATPSPLAWFGFVGVVCGVDDPHDSTPRSRYLDETQGFTNLAHVCVDQIDMHEPLTAAREADQAALLDLTLLLFEAVPGEAPSGASQRLQLRDDVETLWASFVETNRSVLNAEYVAALYLVDEPVWNGATRDDIERAAQLVQAALPDLPSLIVEAPDSLAKAVFPTSVDWIGFDRYGVGDPGTDPGYRSLMDRLEATRSPNQMRVVIMDAQWQPAYREAGLAEADLATTALHYASYADSLDDVVALIAYSWPGGIDGPQQRGARDLPDDARAAYETIGKHILGSR